MRRVLCLLLLLITAALTVSPAAAGAAHQAGESNGAEITSQQNEDVLQGLIAIQGSANLPGFLAYEVTFSYADDTTGTWFLIGEATTPVSQDQLTEWDTSTISDGNYNLRLTVFQEEGLRTHFIVENLRVRNYTPIETLTPTPTLTATPYTVTPQPSPSPTITPQPSATTLPPSATPLPNNPVEIAPAQLSTSLLRGAAGALALFVLAGLYASLQRILRRR